MMVLILSVAHAIAGFFFLFWLALKAFPNEWVLEWWGFPAAVCMVVYFVFSYLAAAHSVFKYLDKRAIRKAVLRRAFVKGYY